MMIKDRTLIYVADKYADSYARLLRIGKELYLSANERYPIQNISKHAGEIFYSHKFPEAYLQIGSWKRR